MKQSKTLRRISVAIVAVLLITMSVLSVTLAKYSTNKEIKGDITTKTWVIDVKKDNSETLTFETFDAMPGMTQKVYEITVNNAGELNATFDATLTANNKPANMTVALKKGTTLASATDVTGNAETNVELNVNSTAVKYFVVINWPYEGTDNVEDAGKTLTLTFAVNATQVNPNPSTPA